LQPGPLWRSMKIKAPFLTPATINILSIAIVACAIFVVDTEVHVDIDVPVLYVAVVLMSTRLFERRGILIVSLGCAVLVVAGYLLSPGNLLTTISIANRLLFCFERSIRTDGAADSPAGQEPPARTGERAQVAIPCQHEPRAAHAAQRHHRADRD